MINLIRSALQESAETKLRAAGPMSEDAARAAELLVEVYRAGRKTLIFGNGGSAADSQHFAAELVGRFLRERRSLPAIALTVDTSALTCIGNDYGWEQVFVRQLEGLASEGDAAIAISTSGNSPNILKAMARARELGVKVIGLTGRGGGGMPPLCDVCVTVPSDVTARIQEVHSVVLHAWCGIVERELFGA